MTYATTLVAASNISADVVEKYMCSKLQNEIIQKKNQLFELLCVPAAATVAASVVIVICSAVVSSRLHEVCIPFSFHVSK